MAVTQSRRHHGGQEGVATQCEEVVVQPDRRVVEDLAPDRENPTLEIGCSALRQDYLRVAVAALLASKALTPTLETRSL
jgi:hypothetical protein